MSSLARPPHLGRDWRVIAHRGGSHLRPENTMSAFSNAVAMGVHALEMDVHATSDGRLVVLHDPSVDRTTDGTGEVRRLSFAEVSRLDAGEGGEFQGQGERIPEFEEVPVSYTHLTLPTIYSV